MPPADTPATMNVADALQALQEGRAPAVQRAAEANLRLTPRATVWLTLLALALSQQQRAADALPCYRTLCELEPTTPEHWSNVGNCLCELGREGEALEPLQRALELGADDAGTHFAMARALSAHAQPQLALQHANAALRVNPAEAEFRLLRARLLLALDEWDAARVEIDRLVAGELDLAQRVDAGFLLLESGLFADAQAAFAGALLAQPAHTEAAIGSAMALERLNRLDDARAVRAALGDAAVFVASGTRTRVDDKLLQLDARLAARASDHPRAQAALRALLSPAPADPALRSSFWFDLGRSCDQSDDVVGAMEAFAHAHRERRSQVAINHPALIRSDSLLAVLDRPLPAALPRIDAGAAITDRHRDPVFLVGFPRSGTTLLEQLLDAHTELASFDEQPFMQRLIMRLNTQAPGYPDVLPDMTSAQRDSLRAAYFADVARVLPALGARRAVDKNPLNLARLPLAAALFPRARVLLALRHPCDVVLSCYMQSFRAPVFAVTFETIASTARMYDRVLRYYDSFAAALALPVHIVRYEDLVDDVRGTGQALFGFLDLPWSDTLLQFTERAARKGSISTPSYSQVVQPVNRRAVGRWERYRQCFDTETLALLAPWVARFGYQPI